MSRPSSEGSFIGGRWGLPALSGALLGASYLLRQFPILHVTAFVPLLAWLDARPTAGAYERLRAGFLFGLVTHLIALHFEYSMLAFSWLAVPLYLGMAVGLGLRIAASVALAGWLRERTSLAWGLLLPLCWLPFEWAETWGDLSFTGEHLAHTMTTYPFLIQFADLFGPYGVGAVILACNGLLFDAISARGRPGRLRAVAALAALLAGILAYDAWAWSRPEAAGRSLRVALVQPNIPLDVKHDPSTNAHQWKVLVDLTREAARLDPDLIVWPESSRPLPLYHWLDRPETFAMEDVQSLARLVGIPILAGVEYVRARSKDDYDVYNAALAVDAEGRLLPDWGAKIHLVPFTEGVPFRRLLGWLVEGRGGEWHWLAGGFTPGPAPAVLGVAGSRIGVVVCYEQLYFDLARKLRNAGAELQVVITNDAWFGRSLFQAYQANAVRLRAIENRSAFVRVANTGISGFVDSRGRYHERTGLFEEAVRVHDVELSSGRTLYDRLGDLVAWLAVAGLVTAVVLARYRSGARI